MDQLIGKVIAGRYEVIRLIARGGMGSVYEVRHQRVKRTFALKTLARELTEHPEALARFRREADVVASLRHPNIVEIVDWETLDDGSPCIVMEYLRGEDLASHIARHGQLPWRTIARYGDQLLSAIGVAHSAGIVHRDLKPQNVFIAVDDGGEHRIKLLDFGVSKIRDSGTMATSAAQLIGTPAYMSPEQADGKGHEVGPEADVWAIGAILHEMATGRVAFQANSMPSILYRVTHGEPESLRAYRPDAPPAFEGLVYQTLSRDPARRLRDIAIVRRGLRETLGGVAPDVFHQTPLPQGAAPNAPISGFDRTISTMSGSAAQVVGLDGGAPRPSRRTAVIAITAGVAIAAAAIVGAVLSSGGGGRGADSPAVAAATGTAAGPAPEAPAPATIPISVIYSSEKQDWMTAAHAAFAAQHPEIDVKLVKMGSLDSASAILEGREQPVLWSPADAVVLDLLAADWKAKHGKDLFAKRGDDAPQQLLLTPLVFLIWEDRSKVLRELGHGEVTWKAIHAAVAANHAEPPKRKKPGWDAIGGDAAWGQVKLGHTDPTLSSSGLLALLSMATEHHGEAPLDEAAIADPTFLAWMAEIERGVTKFEASTGTFASNMMKFGPSQYEIGIVYENLAIEQFDTARQRYADVDVHYPAVTFWSDHPIGLLQAEWVTPAQATAARAFVAFLRSREIQETALRYGFRAADPEVPLKTDDPENPFTKHAARGIRLDIPAARRPASPALVHRLLDEWSTAVKGR